jgi:hypothetical protein
VKILSILIFRKELAAALLVTAALALTMSITANADWSTHDATKIYSFSSIQEITNFFSTAKIDIEPLELKIFKKDHFLFSAFPYSGKDTIDLYCYVKYGEQWVLQMLYFHLRPRQRHLRAEESATQILVSCGEEEVVRLTPDLKLNSPNH